MAVPSDLVVGSNWNDDTSLDYARDGGTLTPSSSAGSPAIVGGGKFNNALDLSGGGTKYVQYTSSGLVDTCIQTGCISFWVKPTYTSAPSAWQHMAMFHAGGGNNEARVIHTSGGSLTGYVFNQFAIPIASISATWNPTAGQWYHIELNWDVTAGATRLFVGGNQIGSTHTGTGTRSGTSNQINIGRGSVGVTTPEFVIDELLIYDAVQHTSNFTPPTKEMNFLGWWPAGYNSYGVNGVDLSSHSAHLLRGGVLE